MQKHLLSNGVNLLRIMLYIRKLFTQDLRDGKQIAFPKEVSYSFFCFDYINKEEDRKIKFTFRANFGQFQEFEGKEITTRLYAAGSESRMDGEVKAFIRDELKAQVDDLLIIKSKGTKHIDFDVMFVPKSNSQYYPLLLNLSFSENHSVYSTEEQIQEDCIDKLPLQQIYYGAPGTGKSHKIKSEVDEKNKICYRTTFHPDSDYSTFVGAYKPSMEKAEEHLYNKEELISKLTELKEQGVTYSPQKFGAKYWYSLKGLSLQEKKDILTACDMSDNYTVEFDKGIAVGEELLKKAKESRIIYGFIPQAFAKAYVHAWNTKDEVYLVIEEINRGNCAQIFGDLFQLLDRKDGFSEYPIDADADLESHIKEKLEKSTRDDIPELVKAGKKLMLPSNLYIWATMNTSDQSLFPIDSAFKRRWDWVYTPIKQHDEEYKIVLGEDAEYDWWGFLEKINQVIDDATSSEDKKLGYFFVKAQDKKVSAEKFVGKVLFYLWNDVFKNYGFDSPIFSKGGNKKFAFSDFFTKSGEPEPEMVKAFLDRLDETIDKENSFKIKNKSTGNSAETAEQA